MDTPSPSPVVVAALVKALKEALGFIFVGFVLATTLYGVSLLQTYHYFRNYSDGLGLKLTVATLFITDTLSTALVSHSIYTYLVLNLTDLIGDTKEPWSFILENGILSITTLLAQGFYTMQIYRVSGNRYLAVVIAFLALATFALGIKETVYDFQHPEASNISKAEVLIVGGLIQGLAALCDIIITLSLVLYLREKRNGILFSTGLTNSTRYVIDKIIIYSISRGAVTAVCQILFLVLNVSAPKHVYWQPFHQIVGKLYVNSVLSTLNWRRSLTGDNQIEFAPNTSNPGFTSARGQSATALNKSNSTSHSLKFATPTRTNQQKTKPDFEERDDAIEMTSQKPHESMKV